VFAVVGQHAMSDDAYITMRVVRHAIEGDGLRYNVGDVGVQPATSPLNLVLLLALSFAFSLLGFSAEQAVITGQLASGILALPAFGCALYLLMCGDRRNSFIAAIAAAIAMGLPGTLQTLGLETILSAALCIGAILAYRSRRFSAMGWLLGLAFLARHDAVILAGLLFFLYYRESKSDPKAKPLPTLAGFLVVIAPWVLFSLLYYGVATPTTLESKAAQGGTVYWPAWYPMQTGHWLKYFFLGSAPLFWLMVVLGAAAVFGAVWKRTRASICVLVFAQHQVLVLAAYSAMRMPDYYWYFVPYGFALIALAGWWLAMLAPPLKKPVSVGASLLGVGLVSVLLVSKAPRGLEVPTAYREVGRYLEQHPPENAAGFMEIGIVGFYAPSVRVFDFAGIATLEQAERVSQNAAHTWLDDPTVADVVVIRGVDHPLEPDFDDRFESLYRREWTGTPLEVFPNGLQVWRLR
jgi:hypothetical protein